MATRKTGESSGVSQAPTIQLNNNAKNKDILSRPVMIGVFSTIAASSLIPLARIILLRDSEFQKLLYLAYMINNTVPPLVIASLVYLKNKSLRGFVK